MTEGLLEHYAASNHVNPNLYAQLQKAIEQLPKGIRQIIQLKYSENLQVSEISEFLNISENTVKTQCK